MFDIPWRDLWRYRDLVTMFSLRDISAQYKQTVLGPAWFVLQPLLTTFVFSFIFGRFAFGGTAQKGVENTPHFLFYMSGLILWGFFADCANKTSTTFNKNAQLFGKVYFPRLAVPLAQVLTNLIAFGVQFGVFLLGMLFYFVKRKWFADPLHPIHFDPNWRVLLLPVFLLMAGMLGVGVGLIISALSTRYRDLAMATAFGLQLWMYGSSVAFPVSAINDPFTVKLLSLNPMVPILEAMRFGFLGFGTVTLWQFALSGVVCAVVFFIGVIMFNRTEQDVMDTV